MKRAFLILLMLLLPLQALAASQRTLAHVLGSGTQPMAVVIKHIAEHQGQVPHHHARDDDAVGDQTDHAGSEAATAAIDGDIHLDKSQKSLKHLADYEHGCSVHSLLPTVHIAALPLPARIAPYWEPASFHERTTTPLRRPPRALA